MTQVIVILDSNTLAVSDWYFSGSPIVPVTPGIRLPVPEGLTWDVVRGVEDPSSPGTFTLEEDPTKLAAKTAQAWTDLRTKRNQLLKDSDWVALADAHLSQDRKDRWFAYRQELRDLPESVTDPVQVEWPVVPDASSRLGAPIEHTDVVEIQEPVSVPQIT